MNKLLTPRELWNEATEILLSLPEYCELGGRDKAECQAYVFRWLFGDKATLDVFEEK